MLCRDPFMPSYQRGAYPCGRCDGCMKDRNSLWQGRILLESLCHEKTCFVTLTYDDEHLPSGGTLVPRDCTLFLKRLRDSYDKPIRYYLAGEYGEKGSRPHYHAALFGIGPEDTALISSAWGLGFVHSGELTPASARYISSYVTKKMMKHDDPRLDGRYPEFSRKSLKPGIGATAVDEISKALNTPAGRRYIISNGDVPTFLSIGDASVRLGRYIRSRLRKSLDLYTVDGYTGEVKYGQTLTSSLQNEKDMQALREDWQNDPKLSQGTFKAYLSAIDQGKYDLMRQHLLNSKGRKSL